METEELYGLFRRTSGVCIDSRGDVAGKMFFGLRGENSNGAVYASSALDKGASCAVIDDREIYDVLAGSYGDRVILSRDALEELQSLAAFRRKQLGIPVLAITGTNGKTTTKELVKSVLSVKYKVCATEGNLNNHIGVPLTLLGIGDDAEFAIVEMGASAPGEISSLCRIALPDYGIITNVGKAHLAGFGSFENVVAAKGELYDFIGRNGGKLFYNSSDDVLVKMLSDRDMLGISYSSDGVSVIRDDDPYLKLILPDGDQVNTRLVGSYNLNNVVAAVSIGDFFGIGRGDAIDAVSSYVPSNNRSQFVQGVSNRIVVDAYNANPTSMNASLRNFESLRGDRKVLILGDMKELGADSLAEHAGILSSISPSDYTVCFFVGEEFRKAAQKIGVQSDTRMLFFDTSDDLKVFLERNPLKDVYILVKGSRSMRLEKVLDVIES